MKRKLKLKIAKLIIKVTVISGVLLMLLLAWLTIKVGSPEIVGALISVIVTSAILWAAKTIDEA